MKRSALRSPWPLLTAAILVASLASACAWYTRVPDWTRKQRRVVVDPAERSTQLALDAPFVGELDCFARSCRQRFRVVVQERGQLTVRATLDLKSQDDQARIVLEAISGPLGQAGTGRGPRTDVTPLAVRREVEPGTYFVMLQSVGGPLGYEVSATLTPSEAPQPEAVADAAPWVEPPRLEPPPALTEVKEGRNAGASFDDAVAFAKLKTFTFPQLARPGEDALPGTRLEQPRDRQLRRLVTEILELRGFRQATGDEIADMVVVVSTRATVRTYANMNILYDRYALRDLGAVDVAPRGTLSIDIIVTRTGRLAWHAWASEGLSRVVPSDETQSEVLRAAVTEALAKFPPR